MTDWWSNIEREIDRLSESAPDPWAAVDANDPCLALTPDQVAFLEQVEGASGAFVRQDEWPDEGPGKGPEERSEKGPEDRADERRDGTGGTGDTPIDP